MKLSACMIAKNEERCIARSINSFSGIADEIIVVDTGSEDATKGIARQLGARVVDFAWQGDFSLAKNRALELASGDWVLFLDADEYFEGDCAQNLRRFIEALPEEIEAVSLRRIELMNAAEASSYTPATRVFRNSGGIRYHGAIHEYLLLGGRTLRLSNAPPDKILLMHDGYSGPLGREKAQRNLTILERLAREGGGDAMLPYYMGQTLISLHRYAEAGEQLAAFLASERSASPVVMRALLWYEEALRMSGGAAPGGSDDAWRASREKLASNALLRFPLYPTAYIIAGNQRFEDGDFERALPLYQKAVALRVGFCDDGGFSENLAEGEYPSVHLRMAICQRASRRFNEAEQSLALALDLCPDLPGAALEYIMCSMNQPAQAVAARMLKWMERAKDKRAYIAAAHTSRCDILYLMLYDKYMGNMGVLPPRDVFFTTMQIIVGETETAANDLVSRIVHSPQWCGSYEASEPLFPDELKRDLELSIVEVTAAVLAAQDTVLLSKLLQVCPPALRDAISLCLGGEVSAARHNGMPLLAMVSGRLTLYNASEGICAMWREVLALF